MIEDDSTTMLINFDKSITNDINVSTITDASLGIFNFDINIVDHFNKINNDEIEDLIIELSNRLKPAHSNCMVFFQKIDASTY